MGSSYKDAFESQKDQFEWRLPEFTVTHMSGRNLTKSWKLWVNATKRLEKRQPNQRPVEYTAGDAAAER